MSHAPHIQRAINALRDIGDDYADFDVTPAGEIVVLPYWAPECVDPDGRPIGTDKKHISQWERVVEALEDVDFFAPSLETSSLGVLLGILGGRTHEGQPVVFRHVGGEE